jgi:hypothetical protein
MLLENGKALNENQLEHITNNYPEYVQEMAHDEIMGRV